MKEDLVRLLKDSAVLMELNGENAFKSRAYANAARAIDRSDFDPAVSSENDIAGIPGVGKGIAESIREFMRSGTIAAHDELRQAVPAGLFEMTQLKGVGPKKILAINEALGIESIGELEYACRENRLVDLKGFGEKTQAKILESIEQWNLRKDNFHLGRAVENAEEILAALRVLDGVQRAELSGELRLVDETISAVDILVVGATPEALQQGLTDQLDDIEGRDDGIRGHGHSGLPVNIQTVPAGLFTWRRHQDSAAPAYAERFAEIAAENKLTIGSEGLKHDGREFHPAGDDELYAALGLQTVPAELRDDAANLNNNKEVKFPTRVDDAAMRGMLHIHSTWSDGRDSLPDMALAAKELGSSYICFCDHSRSAFYANGLDAARLKQQHAEIDEFNTQGHGITVLKGIESDILPDGSLDYPDDVLATFDMIVASVHSVLNMARDAMTARLLRAVENPYTTILGHPTGRLLLARKAYDFDMDAVLERAAECGTVIEINANPHRLDLSWRNARRARDMGIKFAVNPDAHRRDDLRYVRYGLMIARKGGLGPDDIINTMDETQFRDFLAQQKKRRA